MRTNKKAIVKYRQKERVSYGGLSCVNNNRYGEPCKSTFVCLLISLSFLRRKVFWIDVYELYFLWHQTTECTNFPSNKAALRKEIKLDAEKELCCRKTSFHISSTAFNGFRPILCILCLYLFRVLQSCACFTILDCRNLPVSIVRQMAELEQRSIVKKILAKTINFDF
jgi:hypothetical protein